MYDIAIIGLGPAGSTLARLLSKKFNVIAIDKKTDTGGFMKPCGGLLASDAQKALSRFNLTFPKDILVDPQIFAVKTIDTKFDLARYYQRFYVNFDRHKFDLWLMSLIPDHVKIEHGATVLEISKTSSYRIKYQKNSEIYTIEAKFIIGADGANSIVRRSLFPKSKTRTYMSIQEWYVDKNIRPLYSCFFDSSITDCYCWSISKDGFFIFGGAFPIKNSREHFEQLKSKLIERGYVFGECKKTEACLTLRPSGISDFCFGEDNAFLIGEAAGLISPSSLEGISYAFESARILAQVFNANPHDPNAQYSKRINKLKLKLLAKNIKSIFMYTPVFRWLIMKSGVLSIKVD